MKQPDMLPMIIEAVPTVATGSWVGNGPIERFRIDDQSLSSIYDVLAVARFLPRDQVTVDLGRRHGEIGDLQDAIRGGILTGSDDSVMHDLPFAPAYATATYLDLLNRQATPAQYMHASTVYWERLRHETIPKPRHSPPQSVSEREQELLIAHDTIFGWQSERPYWDDRAYAAAAVILTLSVQTP